MRLSPKQITAVKQTAAEVFGPEADIWLFGSRVDDERRGGDIDLLVENVNPDWDALALARNGGIRL